MEITWTSSDSYHSAEIENGADKVAAIQQQILKILDLAGEKEDWNVIILDKWVFNLGRLIGNIQNDDEAVGLDRGYRVGIRFREYYEKMEAATENEQEYNGLIDTFNEELELLVIDALQDPEFSKKMADAYSRHPFHIEVTERGERIDFSLAAVQ